MPAAPQTAAPTQSPDPRQDQAAARTLRLLFDGDATRALNGPCAFGIDANAVQVWPLD